MKKRILGLVLVLAMVICMTPLSASAIKLGWNGNKYVLDTDTYDHFNYYLSYTEEQDMSYDISGLLTDFDFSAYVDTNFTNNEDTGKLTIQICMVPESGSSISIYRTFMRMPVTVNVEEAVEEDTDVKIGISFLGWNTNDDMIESSLTPTVINDVVTIEAGETTATGNIEFYVDGSDGCGFWEHNLEDEYVYVVFTQETQFDEYLPETSVFANEAGGTCDLDTYDDSIDDFITGFNAAVNGASDKSGRDEFMATLTKADKVEFNNVKAEYPVKETADELQWTKGGSDGLTITSTADFSKFANKVTVDGKVVEATNYAAVSGSTKITFTAAFLETLSAGDHSVVIYSTNGQATGTITIKEKAKEETKKEETKKEETKVVETEKVADTADNSAIGVFVALGVMSVAGYVSLKKKEN